MVLEAANNIDVYPFLTFSNLSTWGYRNTFFLVALCSLMKQKTEQAINNHKASSSAIKNAKIILEPFRDNHCLIIQVKITTFWHIHFYLLFDVSSVTTLIVKKLL